MGHILASTCFVGLLMVSIALLRLLLCICAGALFAWIFRLAILAGGFGACFALDYAARLQAAAHRVRATVPPDLFVITDAFVATLLVVNASPNRMPSPPACTAVAWRHVQQWPTSWPH